MRLEPAINDFDRLTHAIHEELTMQHFMHERDIDDDLFNSLVDAIAIELDYRFDIHWNPRWLAPGEPHHWEENGEHFIECPHCHQIAVLPNEQAAIEYQETHV